MKPTCLFMPLICGMVLLSAQHAYATLVSPVDPVEPVYPEVVCQLLNFVPEGTDCATYKCPDGKEYLVCTTCPTGYSQQTVEVEWTGNRFTMDVCLEALKPKPLCMQGWYVDDSGVCAQCPPDAYGNVGTTADMGSNSISDCYIPSGTTFSDDAGAGTYTDDCKYTE